MAERNSTAILTLGTGGDGLGALLCLPGKPPIVATLDGRSLEKTQYDIQVVMEPLGSMLHPGDDAEASKLELKAGRLLSHLLTSDTMSPIHLALESLSERVAEAGKSLSLLLDTRSDALHNLPWELLELLPQDTYMASEIQVARLGLGYDPLEHVQADHLEVVIWLPDPDDPLCQKVATALDARLSMAKRTTVAIRDQPNLPEPPAGAFRIVHILCNSRSLRPEQLLVNGEWLGPELEHIGLLILDVCGAESSPTDNMQRMAWRVVEKGVRACLMPRTPFVADSAIQFSDFLYGALTEGETLLNALADGRRALSSLSMPHRSFRWWNPMLVVADGAVVEGGAPIQIEQVDEAWNGGRREIDAVLALAEDLAQSQGFLGIEHIAKALSTWDNPSPLLRLIQPNLSEFCRDLINFGLISKPVPTPTPRVHYLISKVQGDDDLDRLVREVINVPWVARRFPPHLLEHFADQDGDEETLSTVKLDRLLIQQSVDLEATAGIGMEVYGGPEDGRRFSLKTPGSMLGRWDVLRPSNAGVGLYRGSGACDRTVSRRHLRFLGGAQVEILASTHLVRQGIRTPVRGQMTLCEGDLLVLGVATRIHVERITH